ncbi:aldehyde dehydrogenase family protein [Lentzea flava]|uniref:Betaine aldehyde dehydrogenase n=1 Tax=Lentzea flava TaxID=103732 RepID=A0ABQ2V269_9PSEU|nr:aldehyde dehydrogenase family protein [Lentzea flava]MCP2202507.1 betaine-aldehyde dehydrogenase [Lentzea flava]GGU59575.1 betaine aldehyde dehydrogenase [Lentzea flava]
MSPVRQIINPFDQSVLTEVEDQTREQAIQAIAKARNAFDHGDWQHSGPEHRAAVLNRIADLLERDKEDIARTETLDTGKTLVESRIDVDDVVAVFRYYGNLAGLLHPKIVQGTPPDVISRIDYEPVGVCGMIAPWNYPLLQISWKIAPALLAGNTLVAKPSEITPLTTIKLFELMREAGLPDGVANLVLGTGPEVGAPLSEHPDVDLISFTGSLATGQRIMASAAKTVKKVALELGGKNPNIVFADADIDTAVDYALTAAFFHAGQVCSSGTRLIVHTDIYDDFVNEVARRADKIKLGNGFDEDTESGPLVSAEHRAKVESYVEIAEQEGATLKAGGKRPDEPELQNGFFFRPTVYADCTRTMKLVQDETFGPIITAERFETEDEATFLGNDTDYGLAGGVWSQDLDKAQRVAKKLRHGTVWINEFGPYLPQAEWGGFKRSGVGRELGTAGLHEYTEPKHVYQNLKPAAQNWFARKDSQ